MQALTKEQRRCLDAIFESFLDSVSWGDKDREEAWQLIQALREARFIEIGT